MLKKILQEMYIDPDLLTELDEEQKQLLFCKMREEQIRRWNEWEEKNPDEKKHLPFKPSKPGRLKGTGKVGFLNGADDKPWTWVMGEHCNDKSIEAILESEAHDKADRLARQEAQELRKLHNVKVTSTSEKAPKLVSNKGNDKSRVDNCSDETDSGPKLELLRLKSGTKSVDKDDLQTLEQRRSAEIYMSLKLERDRNKKKIAEDSEQIELAWLEQERLCKKVEEERRSLAKTVREAWSWSNSLNRVRTESTVMNNLAATGKVSSATSSLPLPKTARGNYKNLGKDRPAMPSNTEAVIKWFLDVEEPRGSGLDPSTGRIATWFHGIINREETEELLDHQPTGSFLIRLSDKIWGYVISYKTGTRCKHFLIDAGDTGYQFFGLHHVAHPSLADLIKYHETNPLSVNSQDYLKYPVGQSKSVPDYNGLFKKITLQEESENSYL